MPTLPTGTVTFVFSDIEGSTALLRELGPEGYAEELGCHRAELRNAFLPHEGVELGTSGDAVFFAFPRASGALAAARDGQLALAGTPVSVRIGVHTGEPIVAGGEYVGMDVHKAARLAAAGHGGQILLSAQAAALAGGAELVDLGVHRLKDLTRAERIYQLTEAGLPANFPPLRTLDLHPHNLPLLSTPLIGREREIAEIRKRITAGSHRLLTLLGPAGTGKTRLALQTAADALEAFPDGVYFVNLAPITDPALLTSTISRAMGMRESGPEKTAEGLAAKLAHKRVLLLLDNFEQVVEGAPVVTDLLQSAPDLRVLVTSRIPLRLRAEREYPVSPLGLPGPSSVASPSNVLRSPAVQLFVERAQAVRPNFEITADNAPAVAEICRRLDGLPLAIELAASHVRILDPDAMLARLQSRLKLLTGGHRDLPHRQQTLRNALAWSHDLLNDSERELFRRMSVFAGASTLTALEQVCADETKGTDVFAYIESLVEKSLVQRGESAGEPTVSMLETIREYAREKLEESGEGEAVSRRHAEHYLEFAEESRQYLGGPKEGRWLDRLESAHDNLRAALRRTIDRGEAETATRIASSLQTFWLAHGHLREGRAWLREVLASGSGCSPATHATAMIGAGALAFRQGDADDAQALLQESLRLSLAHGERKLAAVALLNLGALAGERNDHISAQDFFEQSLELLTELGEKRLMCMVQTNLGLTAERRGNIEDAERLYRDTLALSAEIGDKSGATIALSNLGHLLFDRGDLVEAERQFRKSLGMANDAGHTYLAVHELANLAMIAAAAGKYERAATLFSFTTARFSEMGAKPLDIVRNKYALALAQIEAEVSESAAEAARTRGATLSMQEAMELVRQDRPV